MSLEEIDVFESISPRIVLSSVNYPKGIDRAGEYDELIRIKGEVLAKAEATFKVENKVPRKSPIIRSLGHLGINTMVGGI